MFKPLLRLLTDEFEQTRSDTSGSRLRQLRRVGVRKGA